MAVVAFHVRAICSFHLRASPNGNCVEGDLVNDMFSTGSLGVQLFFAISGFILSLPFARCWMGADKPVKLGAYYLRRLTRIEPPYVIHLVFLFLLCALFLRHQPAHQQQFQNSSWLAYSGQHLLASLFYSSGFFFPGRPYPNIVLWSLEVEVQFYLLAPLLAQVFKIGGVWLRRGLLVGTIVLTPFLAGPIASALGNSYLSDSSLLGNLRYFLVGFLLADWLVTKKNEAPRRYFWDLLLILDAAAVVVFRHSSWLYFALPLIVGVCCVAAFCGRLTYRALGNPWITTIGGMCYTIYMYHWLMISLLVRPALHLQTHILWLDLLIFYVLMSAVIVAVCALLFALFERPFMRRDWPARLRERVRGLKGGNLPRPEIAEIPKPPELNG